MKPFIPTFKSNHFSWHAGYGAGELSDFSDQILLIRDDTCFFVESVRTGKKELFTYTGLQRDPEGEITEYDFASKEGHEIVIFND